MCLRASFTAALLAGALLLYMRGAGYCVSGCLTLSQIVATGDHAELEAEVSGKSLKYWG